MENEEYIRKFIVKHNYDTNIHLQCLYPYTYNDVVSVVFNEKDIPSKKVIRLIDIQYDIDSDLPADVFERWLEYCEKNNDVDYIFWMTKMSNNYVPKYMDDIKNEDKLNEDDIKQSINNLFDIFNKKYGLYDDSDSDDLDSDDSDDLDFFDNYDEYYDSDSE